MLDLTFESNLVTVVKQLVDRVELIDDRAFSMAILWWMTGRDANFAPCPVIWGHLRTSG
jgi:hypothetical protein